MSDTGGYYHEPPYTWEEEMAIYKGMDIDGPVTVLQVLALPQRQRPRRKNRRHRRKSNRALFQHIFQTIDPARPIGTDAPGVTTSRGWNHDRCCRRHPIGHSGHLWAGVNCDGDRQRL
jgi:hypothetical protein